MGVVHPEVCLRTARRTAMPRKRHKPEGIVAKLRQVDIVRAGRLVLVLGCEAGPSWHPRAGTHLSGAARDIRTRSATMRVAVGSPARRGLARLRRGVAGV